MLAEMYGWSVVSDAACVKQLWCAGGHRTCTCAALGQGAQLVQVSRQLFMSFVLARPRTLQIYLHKVCSLLSFLALAHVSVMLCLPALQEAMPLRQTHIPLSQAAAAVVLLTVCSKMYQ